MPWVQIRIESTKDDAEQLEDALLAQGAVSVTFMDSEDCPIFEPLPGETRLWGNTVVIGLFEAQTSMQTVVANLQAQGALNAQTQYKIELIEDKDWVREWMKDFKPIPFGSRLWICPSWLPVPDESAVNVMLDPGLAFGTGTHPTTALCLEWLDGLDLAGKTVIDFGCGSGILAIAALKLGAKAAIGIDIDPQALQASLQNAQNNGVADRLTLYHASEVPAGLQAQVVLANILAEPLRQLAAQIAGSLLDAQGQVCLSGILDTQADEIAEIYRHYVRIDEIKNRGEWCRVVGTHA
ncbi:50S ribosomal protein L11 methyltransferase [Pasteurellaceae bacterium HPA106]|uniref:50S ribosomal protein L11 methyltransferase n=1 Tax=Spirabiliibacterium pneumoniae TaxID=221400 RepID=UPI001AAE0AD8|nr:50S ribosomal protein L11 methyltransferase [Spirabiliibacterium pneumoniae]MBE2897200.1 50S ribosomal protein L11 methyltransferase [Spirabiliibacterium pneumoniae]